MLTEGTYLQSPPPTYVDSPWGQKYLTSKATALLQDDIMVRVTGWMASVRGYKDYGTVLDGQNPGFEKAEELLQDWYGHVRDMGKRNLKYKHLPTSLTDTDMLIYLLDAYFFVVANLVSLLNLNRMAQYNMGFANVSEFLPRYMSRITRLWRRTSALAMPNFWKAMAIRGGSIVIGPVAPTMRFWASDMLLVSGSGGPTLEVLYPHKWVDVLQSNVFLGYLVSNLEAVERWLEIGTATILDDFIAVKDLIDMTNDIVPGSFATGLPEASSLPGLSVDPTVMSDILTRAALYKDVVDEGTDRWSIFPVPAMDEFAGRIPVCGMGQPGLFDFCSLGAPKLGYFTVVGARSGDVDDDVRIIGTEFRVGMAPNGNEIRNVFGVDAMEQVLRQSSASAEVFSDLLDADSAADIRDYLIKDSLRRMHIWSESRFDDREAFSNYPDRRVREKLVSYTIFMEPEDIGWNYAELVATSLGIPYIR
jgi:hypothetical protein